MPTASAATDKYVESGLSIGNNKRTSTGEVLQPVPDIEVDFKLKDKFAFSPAQLSELVSSKSLTAFRRFGGLDGLEKGLRTDRRSGLGSDETIIDGYAYFNGTDVVLGDESPSKEPFQPTVIQRTATILAGRHQDPPFADRKRVFQDNVIPPKKQLNILQLMWMAYNDYVLFLLTAAAVVSLAIGLYQTFGTAASPTNPRVEWVEGAAIITVIIIIVIVGGINDWERERQFAKLNKKTQARDVKGIRSGKSQVIPIFDVLVGDVIYLEPGDVIPADGIFIDGHNVKCDESSTTGESELIRKRSGEDAFLALLELEGEDPCQIDPFIISGTKVAEGVGTFLVTATGVNSSHGKILMSLNEDPGFTPLQFKLNKLAKYIAKTGGLAALLLFTVLFIKFLVQLPHRTNTPAEKGQNFLNILIISLTVLVIAVPEGLPLAVTLALAFATNRMLKDNNLVRQLKACETMGNASSICSDKTGTLTQNKMTVVAGAFGTNLRFHNTVAPSPIASSLETASQRRNESTHLSAALPVKEFVQCLADDVKEMLKQSIVINSTAFEGEVDNQQTFIGSQTETALLTFAREYLGMDLVSNERSNTKIVQLIPFDATRQSMGTVVELESGQYRLYVKGASEVVLGKCSAMEIIQGRSQGFSDTEMTVASTEYLSGIITDYASRSLRTICLAYRDFNQWPPPGLRTAEDNDMEVNFEDLLKELVFFGITGIQDPLRNGAHEAVQACQRAGVVVRMVTGDNILTAKAIAGECGIISSTTDIAMKGSEFRSLSRSQMTGVIPHLKVLARASPEDKRTLVMLLKEMGEVVAVTGDGTNDALALTAADIGFSMGVSGTEVAREASSIVLMDDNFASIVKAIMWGRAVNDAVKQFLQFQITVSITSVMLTFVSAAANSEEQSVLTAVQLMWINIFQDTMAALALATDAPPPSILDRPPDRKSAPLINTAMWKMILGQSVYQIAVTCILYFGGAKILSYYTVHQTAQLQTLVFNTYVWMQIFNMYNNRQLDNKFNIFEGIWRNWFFIAISLIMIGGQILIVFIGGRAFSVTRIDGAQWGISIVLGALSLPVGVIIRLIPDKLFEGRRIWGLNRASAILGHGIRRRVIEE